MKIKIASELDGFSVPVVGRADAYRRVLAEALPFRQLLAGQ